MFLQTRLQMTLNNQNRYAFADGLRGLAALWVVFHHLYGGNHIEQLSSYIGTTLTTILFEYGNLGVPIFFVLSGFVMAVTTNSKKMGAEQAAKFMLRRLVRISPPYYFAIILSLALLFIKIRYFEPQLVFPEIKVIAAHFFYIQGLLGYQQINTVYWTLCYEIQFYLVFSVIIYVASKFNKSSLNHVLILIATTLPGIVWLIFSTDVVPLFRYTKYHFIFITYWYAFSVGALVGWAITRENYFKYYVVVFYIAIILLGFVKSDAFALTAGVTAFAIHLALQKNKMDSWLNIRPLQTLGLISYSLYLIHNNVIGLVERILRRLFEGGIFSDLIFAAISLLICLSFAYLMYVFIEKPVIKISQRIKY